MDNKQKLCSSIFDVRIMKKTKKKNTIDLLYCQTLILNIFLFVYPSLINSTYYLEILCDNDN